MTRRWWRRPLLPREQRGRLGVMFIHTELLLGGAETLLLELIRHMDRSRFAPRIALLQRLGPLGEAAAAEVPLTTGWLKHKFDAMVVRRLSRHLRETETDAVITVGTGGDRMFWGRLAAWHARVPVILSAIHSTGVPHGIELPNRWLTPITDGFIGCARQHSRYLVEQEGCPSHKVFTVPNGVDVSRFRPGDQEAARARMGWSPEWPIAGIVAALRPEKQHVLLIEAWSRVVEVLPRAKLMIVGDGPERTAIEQARTRYQVEDSVWMLGRRDDVPDLLPALDVMVLASKMEANPASTLEASACGIAVVAPDVGSLGETVVPEETGLLYPGSQPEALAAALVRVLSNRPWARRLGVAGRSLVAQRYSLEVMVGGYERLIEGLYDAAWTGKRFLPADLDEGKPRASASEKPQDSARSMKQRTC